MKRMCINPKEVSVITGFTERYGRTVLNKIRKYCNKQPHQLITIEEFSNYYGFDPEEVRKRL